MVWVQILTALLIAAATVFASWFATRQAHQLDRHQRAETEQEELNSVLWAIHSEITEVVDHYFHSVGNRLEREQHPNTPFERYMVAEQQYFTMYESTAATLGRLQDRRLLLSIMRTYMVFKRIIDVHRIQQSIIEAKRAGDPAWEPRAIDNKPQLLELHSELKRASKETRDLLEQRHGPLQGHISKSPAPEGYMPGK